MGKYSRTDAGAVSFFFRFGILVGFTTCGSGIVQAPCSDELSCFAGFGDNWW
jgi:hypothetical protein